MKETQYVPKTWVTSDFHFNHKNICGPGLSVWSSGYRAFGSIEEMNETILRSLNQCVAESDTLYFLGDFAFGDKEKIPGLFARIHCQNIHVIFGNHDSWLRRWLGGGLGNSQIKSYGDYLEVRQKGLPLVVMAHYPLEVWNENGRGSVHLHGHSHGNLARRGRRHDVGVDTNDFWPYEFENLVRKTSQHDVSVGDHHTTKLKGY